MVHADVFLLVFRFVIFLSIYAFVLAHVQYKSRTLLSCFHLDYALKLVMVTFSSCNFSMFNTTLIVSILKSSIIVISEVFIQEDS